MRRLATPAADVTTAPRRPDDAEFASTDEVIVYKDEGEADDAKTGPVENLTEEKLGLLTETEQVISETVCGPSAT